VHQDLQPNINTTTTIMAESQSAITRLKNRVLQAQIDVAYNFARERVTRNDAASTSIPTAAMVAYSLTKPVPATKAEFCSTSMGIHWAGATQTSWECSAAAAAVVPEPLPIFDTAASIPHSPMPSPVSPCPCSCNLHAPVCTAPPSPTAQHCWKTHAVFTMLRGPA
jgi:hypothetical protein